MLCPQCRTALCGTEPFRVRPVLEPPGLPAVHAAAHYADEVRAVLLAHKERGALALARPLGAALAGAVWAGLREAEEGVEGVGEGEGPQEGPRPPNGVLLVPVPSARAAVRARGHDPARRIALAAAGELRRSGVPARVAAVLRQRRPVADQAGLDSRGRLDNLVGALAVVPGGVRVLCGAPVVLVDDLVTTGASLAEAARAVRAATGAGMGAPMPMPVPTGAGTGRAGADVPTGLAGRGVRDQWVAGGERPGRPDRAGSEDPEDPEAPGGSAVQWDPVGPSVAVDRWVSVDRSGPSAGVAQVGRMDGGGAGTGGVRDLGEAEGGMCGGGVGAVYAGVTREGRKVKPSGAREEGGGGAPVRASGSGGPGVVLCAAVVAAPPDSFEINRN